MLSSFLPICLCWTSLPKSCPAQTTGFVFKIKLGPPQGITNLQERQGVTGREGRGGQEFIPPCHGPGSCTASSQDPAQDTRASVVWAGAAAKQRKQGHLPLSQVTPSPSNLTQAEAVAAQRCF